MPYRDDAQRPAFDVDAAAARIASEPEKHDSFKKHVEKGGEFKDQGIKTREDYARHIADTMRDSSTVCFHSHDDRTIFFNQHSNTFVVHDPHNPHNGGTCYQPKGGSVEGWKQLGAEFGRDVQAFNGSPDMARVVPGGYRTLYGDRAIEPGNPELPPPDTKPELAKPAAPAQPAPDPARLFRRPTNQDQVPKPEGAAPDKPSIFRRPTSDNPENPDNRPKPTPKR